MLQAGNGIAYINQVFPKLSETFVYREILAVRERGIPINTFSIWRPDVATLSAESASLGDETTYIFPADWLSIVKAHMHFILTRTQAYFSLLFFILFGCGETFNNRRRIMGHFLYGMGVVGQVEVAGVRHVHAHFAWSAANIAYFVYRLLGVSFSMTVHSNEIYFERMLLQEKLEQAKFVVTISEYNRQFMKDLYPSSPIDHKIHIVHCGVDVDVFAPSTVPATKSKPFTIVGVAQLVPRKGFHILVEACHHLAQRNISFSCHILGEGDERPRLEALIKKYNLQDKVHLPGRIYQEELRQRLAEADVFALPCIIDDSGDQDGIPVALMEAMALEMPCISTPVSGIPELIQHQQNGLLVPPDDPVALADALQQLMDDTGLGQNLGQAARETIISDFDIYKSAEQMSHLFAQMLQDNNT